jgi:hypothetical protein
LFGKLTTPFGPVSTKRPKSESVNFGHNSGSVISLPNVEQQHL